MEHWAFSLVWTLPAVLPPCLWKGSLLCLLWLPAGPAEVGGKGRPLTKMLNCFQKAPRISVPDIWQSQADGEQRRVRTWQFDYWPDPDGGPKWGGGPVENLFQTQKPKVCMGAPWLGPLRTAWPHNPCRKSKRMESIQQGEWKKSVQTYEESNETLLLKICDDSSRAWAKTLPYLRSAYVDSFVWQEFQPST